MPSVESANSVATALRSAAGTTASVPGVGGAFARMMEAFAASLEGGEASATATATAAAATPATPAAGATDATTTSAGETKSTETADAATAKAATTAATDLLGALALVAQGTIVTFSDAGGLASPASLGAVGPTASATSSSKPGIDPGADPANAHAAPTSPAAGGAAATTATASASATAAAAATAATAAATTDATSTTTPSTTAGPAMTASATADQEALAAATTLPQRSGRRPLDAGTASAVIAAELTRRASGGERPSSTPTTASATNATATAAPATVATVSTPATPTAGAPTTGAPTAGTTASPTTTDATGTTPATTPATVVGGTIAGGLAAAAAATRAAVLSALPTADTDAEAGAGAGTSAAAATATTTTATSTTAAASTSTTDDAAAARDPLALKTFVAERVVPTHTDRSAKPIYADPTSPAAAATSDRRAADTGRTETATVPAGDTASLARAATPTAAPTPTPTATPAASERGRAEAPAPAEKDDVTTTAATATPADDGTATGDASVAAPTSITRVAGLDPAAARAPVDVSPAVAATAMAALAESIAKRGHQGTSRFSVRLDPAELGSVDVRVEVRANGEVKAHLVVERADTLDMMLRDQKTLERSLASAGLDVGSSGLQFSMRDRGDGSATPERGATPTVTTATEEEDAGRPSPDVAIAAYRTARAGGVDLRI